MGLISTILTTDQCEVHAELDDSQQNLTLRISGVVNEDVNFGVVLDQLGANYSAIPNALIDVQNIQSLNSVGVRGWLLFLERLQQSKTCRFIGLSEAFVEQSNLVANMLGRKGTPVETFVIPYYCEKCNDRFALQFQTKDLPADLETFTPAPVKCTKCGSSMEFDSLPEEYFSFLRHHHAHRPGV